MENIQVNEEKNLSSASSESPANRAGMASKRQNKYIYGWKLYVNYGQGWEYETFEETFVGYRENRKAYRENCDYPQRWSRGRELNEVTSA